MWPPNDKVGEARLGEKTGSPSPFLLILRVPRSRLVQDMDRAAKHLEGPLHSPLLPALLASVRARCISCSAGVYPRTSLARPTDTMPRAAMAETESTHGRSRLPAHCRGRHARLLVRLPLVAVAACWGNGWAATLLLFILVPGPARRLMSRAGRARPCGIRPSGIRGECGDECVRLSCRDTHPSRGPAFVLD